MILCESGACLCASVRRFSKVAPWLVGPGRGNVLTLVLPYVLRSQRACQDQKKRPGPMASSGASAGMQGRRPWVPGGPSGARRVPGKNGLRAFEGFAPTPPGPPNGLLRTPLGPTPLAQTPYGPNPFLIRPLVPRPRFISFVDFRWLFFYFGFLLVSFGFP